MPVLGFLFKNQTFMIVLKLTVLALFIYGVYMGFADPGEENIFTQHLFWGLFWSLFIVITLTTFGRIFCGICPHGFLGKYITKFGLKKEMPNFLKNRFIGVFILFLDGGPFIILYRVSGKYRLPQLGCLLPLHWLLL